MHWARKKPVTPSSPVIPIPSISTTTTSAIAPAPHAMYFSPWHCVGCWIAATHRNAVSNTSSDLWSSSIQICTMSGTAQEEIAAGTFQREREGPPVSWVGVTVAARQVLLDALDDAHLQRVRESSCISSIWIPCSL